MKLQHLPIGASFEYEGKVYVKTGPLTAVSEEGGSRIIPRSAVLRAASAATPATAAAVGGGLERATVLAAFDEFHQLCVGLVDETAREQLAAARQRFLATVGG